MHCDKWPDLCAAHGVTAYPLVRIYTSGKGKTGVERREHVDYSGEWASAPITKWASECFPNKVTKLSAESHRRKVDQATHAPPLPFFKMVPMILV